MQAAFSITCCVFITVIVFGSSYAEEKSDVGTAGQKSNESRLVTIAEGINIVLKDSRLVKIAAFDTDIAFQDSLVARSGLLPEVNASLTQTFLRQQPAALFGSQAVNTSNKSYLSYDIDIYQTLFDFGRSFLNYKAARDLFNATKAKLEMVKRLAVLEFVESYFDLLESEKMIAVSQKETENLSSYLGDVRHLYEQGVVVKNDLLPAEVKFADAKQRLILRRNARALAAARLNNILAFPLRGRIRAQDINMIVPAIPSVEQSYKTAEAERFEVKVITEEISASSLRQKAKITSQLPIVYAQGGYTYKENKFATPQNNAFINLGAKMDVFDGWASKAEFLKEHAIHMQLLSQKNKLIEDIKLEVEDSHLNVKDAIEKVAVASDVLAQAEENVRVNRARYTEGSVTVTDVLEAVALWTGAQTNYYSANYELKRAYARLMYSMGIDLALVYGQMQEGER